MAEERWGGYQIGIALVMVATGSLNTLAAKWADKLTTDDPASGKPRPFDHPFLQAVCMFIGEFSCLLVFAGLHLVRRWQWSRKSQLEKDLGPVDSESSSREPTGPPEFPMVNPLVFLPAAMCDMCATSVMYLGLNLTNAASFQMLRGAVIIFTGLLSVAFLRAKLRCVKWLGMGLVVAGLAVVGVSDIFFGDHSREGHSTKDVLTGDLLIIVAQVIVAAQMVYEQKVIGKYDVAPLLAVGWEGFWGMSILSTLLIPFYFIKVPAEFSGDPEHRLENALSAFREMEANPLIVLALLGTIVSIAFFNFAGISVTKDLSATTRMVLDTVRTVVIWAFSLLLGWQEFIALMILGFVLLFVGMCVYNDLLFAPFLRSHVVPGLEARGCPCPRCCVLCCLPPLELDVGDQDSLVTEIDAPED